MVLITRMVILFLLMDYCQSRSCILAPVLSSRPAYSVCEVELEGSHNLTSIIVLNSQEDFNAVVQFVSKAFSIGRNKGSYQGIHCEELTGVVGDLDAKTASIIHTLASRANLNITLVSAVAPSSSLPTTHLDLPNLLHMNPLTHYVDALAAFLDHLNWTRIGLISDDTPYYEFAAELVQQKLLEGPKRQIIPFLRLSKSNSNQTKMIEAIRKYKTDVTVISVREEMACSLMQEAKRLNYVWPEYAWLYIDVNTSAKSCLQDGMVLFEASNQEEPISNQGRCQAQEFEEFLNSETVRTSISLLEGRDDSLQVKFREGRRLVNISIIQANNSKISRIGLYNVESRQLGVLQNFSSATDKPRGTTLRVTYNDHNVTLHILFVNLIFVLLFLFITAVFILYIYFRNEPEIKATSVTVSLSMFVGCYMLISYLPLLVAPPTTDFHCHLLIWMSLAGIPYALILATIFAKMLRIYLLFADPLSFKKKLFTDPFLFLYILLLISPTLLVLVIWSSSDPFNLIHVEIHHENFIFVDSMCTSNHSIKWLITLLFYIFLLSLALTCVALQTANIRKKIFRDNKATNAFAYLSCYIGTLTLIYWYYLGLQELAVSTLLALASVLYIGHSLVAILCQLFLFVPKVYPPLKRRLTQNRTGSITFVSKVHSPLKRRLISQDSIISKL